MNNLKRLLILIVFLSVSLSAQANSFFSFSIGSAGMMPMPVNEWIPSHYQCVSVNPWGGNCLQYAWIPGHWVQEPVDYPYYGPVAPYGPVYYYHRHHHRG